MRPFGRKAEKQDEPLTPAGISGSPSIDVLPFAGVVIAAIGVEFLASEATTKPGSAAHCFVDEEKTACRMDPEMSWKNKRRSPFGSSRAASEVSLMTILGVDIDGLDVGLHTSRPFSDQCEKKLIRQDSYLEPATPVFVGACFVDDPPLTFFFLSPTPSPIPSAAAHIAAMMTVTMMMELRRDVVDLPGTILPSLSKEWFFAIVVAVWGEISLSKLGEVAVAVSIFAGPSLKNFSGPE